MIRSLQRARELLKSVFGYDDFRPGQEEVIAAVLAGEPVLAIMPTGSGKSMCYQLPALVEESLTLVISPLIALMRDQVQQMRTLGVAAATLNSMNTDDDTRETWSLLRNGQLRILFISPERLMVDGLIPHLQRAGVSRVAIDEAHCISEWGHDFRPEYRQLRQAVEALGRVQVVALTATADRATQGDIVERLFETAPKVFVHSFDRPNLHLRFVAKDKPRMQLGDFLNRHRGQSGIIYCASRKRTEDLSAYFQEKGFEAIPYHAGLDQSVRHRHQDRFLQENGVVAVATVAFGMGINKPDVRFVAHADMPASVEAYYQEIGRAGRDGLPADTLTLYGLDDMALRRRQIDEKQLEDGRRRIEHRRLSSMTMLCEATACRRQLLLAHFGENSAPCGACDVCQGKVVTYDGTLDAQKVLSAVWRTGQRFGSDYLVHLLTGLPTEQMQRNGHDRLKTFGVGRDKTKAQWTSIIRQLFASGVLDTASEEFGGFCLGAKGDAILRGGETIELREAKEPLRQKAKERRERAEASAEIDDDTARIVTGLKKLRRELAREAGVAAFMIFADRTLLDMASKRPATLDDMREVYGVGERKLDQYGEAFLHALAEL